MTKLQKIRIMVFLGVFIIPEILWSPVSSWIYSLLHDGQEFRSNFLTNSSDPYLWLFFLGLQFAGILCTLILVSKIKFNLFVKTSLLLILAVLLMIVGFIFYATFYMRHGISF